MTYYKSDVAIARPTLPHDVNSVYEDENRSNQVLNEMHRFYRDERWVDIVLNVEGQSFPSHRLVLAASSLYFERMLTNGMYEEKAKEVTLNNVTADSVKRLLEFSYTSKLEINSQSVLEVFEAADMLQFPSARSFCEQFLACQIEESNCLAFMMYADAFSSETLYEKAILIAANSLKKQSQTDDYLLLPLAHVINLLKNDNIEMEYEEHVFDIMKLWILYDPDKRKQFVPELLKCVRLNYVSRWFLIEIISKDPLLADIEVAQDIIRSAKDQLLAQGHTYEIPWQLPPSRKKTGLTRKLVFVSTSDPHPCESEVHLFDLYNKSWSNTSKACPHASEFSSCENIDDTLLVIGGWNTPGLGRSLNESGAVNLIHEFRVMSIFPTLWYVCAHKMGISRYLHSTVSIEKDLYLIGGYDENRSLQSSMYVTSADRGYRFDICPRLMYPVARPAAATYGDRIFVFGGYGDASVRRQTIQCYDIHKRQWCEISTEGSVKPYDCQYATFINDVVYVLAGEKSNASHTRASRMIGHDIPKRVVDCVYTFHPHTRKWSLVFSFPCQRSGSMSFTKLEDKIFITGGEKNEVPYYSVDCYDPSTNTLETVGNTRECSLSLCTTMKVMHENFGL